MAQGAPKIKGHCIGKESPPLMSAAKKVSIGKARFKLMGRVCPPGPPWESAFCLGVFVAWSDYIINFFGTLAVWCYSLLEIYA